MVSLTMKEGYDESGMLSGGLVLYLGCKCQAKTVEQGTMLK